MAATGSAYGLRNTWETFSSQRFTEIPAAATCTREIASISENLRSRETLLLCPDIAISAHFIAAQLNNRIRHEFYVALLIARTCVISNAVLLFV